MKLPERPPQVSARHNDQPLELRIRGMDCAEEVVTLKRALLPIVGDENRLSFDVLNGKLVVDLDSLGVTSGEVIAAVGRTGMRAEVWRERDAPEIEPSFWQRYQRTILTTASGLLGLLGFLSHAWIARDFTLALGSEGMGIAHHVPPLSMALYVLGIGAGIWLVLPKAWHSAVSLRPDINLLMTIAVVGAVAIGEWLEGATVAFLFSVSLLLESWSVRRARRAIASLMGLAPPTARVRDEAGELVEVDAGEVVVGTRFVVRPGEKIPLDGVVREGLSGVNQAPITGESLPVEKASADEVFAGSINGDGLLEIESTKAATDTTLARIIQMVSEAQSRRAPSEKWVERFAVIYTPLVLATAALVLLVPPLLLGGEWRDWFYRSLVLLVIACPCALVISTPVSIVSSLAAAARNGVLIKGGVYAELPARLKAIAMDKTGTLTAGQPTVVEVIPTNGHDEVELLTRAGALESHSNHPLARAILAEAERRGVAIPIVQQFQTVPGKGAIASIEDRTYWIGSHRYLLERGQETPQVQQQLKTLQQAGRTVVVIGSDHHVCGFIALADTMREEAKQALAELRELGIEHLVMLTGDNEAIARSVADQVGIDEVHAELMPEDKLAAVESLVARYGNVAMIGDGVNDAPALGRSSLGIAMGAAGSDAAIETADVALMSDDLSKLPWLVAHSRRTLAIIRQNVVFSLAVKALFVLLTFAGYASLWAAIAADMGASLLVVFNGLRLLHSPPR